MERAVLRLTNEGNPFAEPSRDDDDIHIFVRWQLRLSRSTQAEVVAASIKSAFDLVWHRADSILENSDSVLILGKDTGAGLDRLKTIKCKLEELGYYIYIIKEQPDRLGESVVQKVLRYALSSKFVLIENTEPSGHLYEIPHVAKAGECVTVERGNQRAVSKIAERCCRNRVEQLAPVVALEAGVEPVFTTRSPSRFADWHRVVL
jgi:hypothetical protein